MPANRQPELYAAAIIPYTAAAVALVLRMVARRKTRVHLVWEDYLAIVAFLVGTGFTIISLLKVRWGIGEHVQDVKLPKAYIVYHQNLDLWVDMWLYTFSVGLSKFVILGFYWRMFSKSFIRQPIRILFACSAIWIVVRVVLICLQCIPIQNFWNPAFNQRDCLLSPMLSLFAASIPHFVIEVAILLCPLIEIWRLHLGTAKKFAVAAMFMSGFLVCCSALGTIVHTVMLDKRHDKDLTWDPIDDQIWAVCDVNLASFATSLPLLRPILRSFGGIFSGLRSTRGAPTNDITNVYSTPTYGSGTNRRTRTRKEADTDSVIEFANEGTTSKAYALRDVSPRSSDLETDLEVGDCIHVHTETIVDYGKV